MPVDFIAGVDIGGTKILAIIANAEGKVLAKSPTLTQSNAGPQVGIQQIIQVINQVYQQAGIPAKNKPSSIGIAIAGLVDMPRGVLVTSPHLPGWLNVPIKEQIEMALGMRTFVINDARAAALGEQKYGAGKGIKHQIYITISTGIGGGIIIDDALYTGKGGTAGEIGHMVIDASGPRCDCGNYGCLEALASGTRNCQRDVQSPGQR